MEIYHYSKAVNGDLLGNQITALVLPGYRWLSMTEPSGVDVAFENALSAPDHLRLDQAVAAHDASQRTALQQQTADAATARSAIVSIAQSAVGKTPANWTNNEFRALVALLIWESGGLNADTTLKPLAQWLKP